jgi:membrane protein DedA with SNARE-associated domain
MDHSISEYILVVVIIFLTFVVATVWLKRKARRNRK